MPVTIAQHAPGPWEANEHGEIWRHYRDEMGNRVSHPIGEAVAVPGLEHQQLPNAKVMAAAPLLLSALVEVLEHYCSLANSGDAGFWNPEDEPEVKRARAVLAALEGR